MKLLFATNNVHKLAELRAAVGNVLELVDLKSAQLEIDIAEPYDTLEANASEKSRTIYRLTGLNCLSEDSGIEVAALQGAPGARSARFSGPNATAEKNITYLLGKMVTAIDRSAQFRTVISLIIDGREYLFEGLCKGTLATETRGDGGFGYDPIFIPQGSTKTFGQMSQEEKSQFSHRKKAGDKLITFLQEGSWSGNKEF